MMCHAAVEESDGEVETTVKETPGVTVPTYTAPGVPPGDWMVRKTRDFAETAVVFTVTGVFPVTATVPIHAFEPSGITIDWSKAFAAVHVFASPSSPAFATVTFPDWPFTDETNGTERPPACCANVIGAEEGPTVCAVGSATSGETEVISTVTPKADGRNAENDCCAPGTATPITHHQPEGCNPALSVHAKPGWENVPSVPSDETMGT